MLINGKDININDLVNEINNESDLIKKRKNNIYLSDKDILVLKKYGINYLKYFSVEELIFDIEDILNNEYFDDLELLSKKLSDLKYYNYTNK